jgi:hypothetical protein
VALELLELGLQVQSLVLPQIAADFQVADADLQRLDLVAALPGLLLPAVAGEAERASQGTFGGTKLSSLVVTAGIDVWHETLGMAVKAGKSVSSSVTNQKGLNTRASPT